MRSILASISRKYLLLFLAIYCLLLVGGWSMYSELRNQIVQHAETDLSAIAEMKRSEIKIWLNERFQDAEVLSDYSLLGRQFDVLIKHGAINGSARASVLNTLNEVARGYHYDSLSFYDPQGKLLITTTSANSQPIKHDAEIRQAIARGEAVLVDFYRDASSHAEGVDSAS